MRWHLIIWWSAIISISARFLTVAAVTATRWVLLAGRATSSGVVMVGDALAMLIGRAPVRGGHTIREAAVPSSPGLKGINLQPLPGCRAPWRSARVRGTGWWCFPLFMGRMPLSAIAAELWGTYNLRTAFDVNLSTYRQGQPSDSSYESVHSATMPKWWPGGGPISYSPCGREHTKMVMHSCFRHNTSTYYTGYHLILRGSFR